LVKESFAVQALHKKFGDSLDNDAAAEDTVA
jgi:hypothetical protein